MLFAPKAGAELRNQLGGAGGPAADDGERRVSQATEKVSQIVDRGP